VDLAREACGGVRVKLDSKAEFLNRIFIGSHSLPPLWFAVSVLQQLMRIISLGTYKSKLFESH
jgi:hypothetical protein